MDSCPFAKQVSVVVMLLFEDLERGYGGRSDFRLRRDSDGNEGATTEQRKDCEKAFHRFSI
jgi:hypothetical protein